MVREPQQVAAYLRKVLRDQGCEKVCFLASALNLHAPAMTSRRKQGSTNLHSFLFQGLHRQVYQWAHIWGIHPDTWSSRCQKGTMSWAAPRARKSGQRPGFGTKGVGLLLLSSSYCTLHESLDNLHHPKSPSPRSCATSDFLQHHALLLLARLRNSHFWKVKRLCKAAPCMVVSVHPSVQVSGQASPES